MRGFFVVGRRDSVPGLRRVVEGVDCFFAVPLALALVHPFPLAVAVMEEAVDAVAPVELANCSGLAQTNGLVAVGAHLHDVLRRNPQRLLEAHT